MSLILAGAPYSVASQQTETLIASFTLENTESSASPVLWRGGMPFKDGDVPSTSALKIRRNSDDSEVDAYQFDLRVTWPSGALKHCTCSMRDETDIAGSSSRVYDIYEVSNSSFDNTGTFSLADVKSASNWTVELADVWESVADLEGLSNLLTTTIASGTVNVNYTSHGVTTGSKVFFERNNTFDGIDLSQRVFDATYTDDDNFTITHPSDTATAGVTSGGSSINLYRYATGKNNHSLVLNNTSTSSTYAIKRGSGAACDYWEVWQFANDDVTTNDDTQQIGKWLVYAWNDGSDTINGNTEVCCVLGRPIWDVSSKSGWIYTATLKENGTTKDTYTDVVNVAHSDACATVRVNDDYVGGAGRYHWQTDSQKPTLNYKPSKSYWQTTKVFPPFKDTVTPSAYGTQRTTYEAASGFSHRTNDDGTGGYLGRGIFPETDVIAWMRQNATDVQTARINAFAGLHWPYHFRTNTNTVIPLKLTAAGTTPSATTYNADGLPNTQHAYRGSTSDATHLAGYTEPTGGGATTSSTWIWNLSGNESHGVNFCQYMYMLEGCMHWYNAIQDRSMATLHKRGTDGYGVNLLHYVNTTRRSNYSIPSSTWDAIGCGNEDNYRDNGLDLIVACSGWSLTADNDIARNYFDDLIAHHALYLKTSHDYMSTAQKALGLVWEHRNQMTEANYMYALCNVGIAWAYSCTNEANFKTVSETAINWTLHTLATGTYMLKSYVSMRKPVADEAPEITASGYFPFGELPWCLVAADTISNVVTKTHPWGGSYQDNDEVYWADSGGGEPSQISVGTVYYALNADSAGFEVEASIGGGGLTLDDLGDTDVSIWMTDADKTLSGDDGWESYLAGGDGEYPPMHWAALVLTLNNDSSTVTTTHTNKVNTFFNGADPDTVFNLEVL